MIAQIGGRANRKKEYFVIYKNFPLERRAHTYFTSPCLEMHCFQYVPTCGVLPKLLFVPSNS